MFFKNYYSNIIDDMNQLKLERINPYHYWIIIVILKYITKTLTKILKYTNKICIYWNGGGVGYLSILLAVVFLRRLKSYRFLSTVPYRNVHTHWDFFKKLYIDSEDILVYRLAKLYRIS